MSRELTMSEQARRTCWCLLAVLVAVDGLKHAFFLLPASPPTPQLDAAQYWQLASQMANGDWMLRENANAYRTPGYPAFLAIFQHAFGGGGWFAAVAAQHVLVVGTSLVSAYLAFRLTGRALSSLFAYGLLAFAFVRGWQANLLLTETLFAFLLILVVVALVSYERRPSPGRIAMLGLLIGIASLVRPVASLLWVPCLPTLFLAGRFDKPTSTPLRWPSRAGHLLILLLVTYAVMTPWMWRNHQLYGRFFLTEFLGRNLWVVTFQEGSGAGLELTQSTAGEAIRDRIAGDETPVDLKHTWSVSDALIASGLTDPESDQLMREASLRTLQEHPRIAWSKFVRRTVNFWRAVSNPFPFYDWSDEPAARARWSSREATRFFQKWNEHAFSRSLGWNAFAFVATFVGLCGMYVHRATRAIALGLLLILLYFNVTTSVLEIPAYRYRMILEPLMVLAVTTAVTQRWKNRTVDS